VAKKQLSPEQYVRQKARSLPVYKCYVTTGWQESKKASVGVFRKHSNGNITGAFYLVDLLCLGVKDTFLYFNTPEVELDEFIFQHDLDFEEIEYNLAHNIIFAAHDYAFDYDITPHPDFDLTKHILEEDDEKIPLTDIPVGDDEGKPYLVVEPDYNYAPILSKLDKVAGKGNYNFTILDDEELEDDDFDYEDDDDDQEDYDWDDEDDVADILIEDIDDGNLEFRDIVDLETEDLEEILENHQRSFSDLQVIEDELLFRRLDELQPGTLQSVESVRQNQQYTSYESAEDQWEKLYPADEKIIEKIFPELRSLSFNEGGMNNDELFEKYLQLLMRYNQNEGVTFIIFNAISLPLLLLNLPVLLENFDRFTPIGQLVIAYYTAAKGQYDERVKHLLESENLIASYPLDNRITVIHYRVFWLIKATLAILSRRHNEVITFHNLLRFSGTGGHLRMLYCAQLNTYLKKYLGIETYDKFVRD
jgi:hypothetical protein